jgi:hypothetical protein
MDRTLRELPREWIERLFTRFRSIYGNRMETMWGGASQADLLPTWADELGGFEAADIRGALEALRTAHPDYPPTLYQFAALCREARLRRTGNVATLPAPKTKWDDIDPRVRAEIERWRHRPPSGDPKDWARKILAAAEAGTYRTPIGIHNAKVALGLVRE